MPSGERLGRFGCVLVTLGLAACNSPTVHGTKPDAAVLPDTAAPTFAGVTSVEGVATDQIKVSWAPASDDVSPPDQLNYRVYVATRPGGEDFAHPAATAAGVSTVNVSGLSPAVTYFVVVRAADQAGNEDTNQVEKSGATRGGAPASPSLADVDLAGTPRSATVSGGALYLPLGPAGLQLLELRDPSTPTPEATLDVGGTAEAVAADRVAGLAAVLRGDGTVILVDTGDLSAPQLAAAPLPIQGRVDQVAVSGRTVSVVAGRRLLVFGVLPGGVDMPSLRGGVDLPASAISLAATPDRVYVGTGGDGAVVAVDVTGDTPSVTATVPVGMPVTRLVASDGMAIAAPDSGDLSLIDFSLDQPAVAGHLPAMDVGKLALAGRTLVLSRNGGAVNTFDLSKPDAPKLVGSNPNPAPVTWVAALRGAAMFGSGTHARVVNTPPFAQAQFPAPDATPKPGAWLDLVLSEPIDPSTVDLTVQADGHPVDGKAIVIDGGRKIRFKPATPIGAGATVAAHLGAGLRDRLGGAIPGALDWTVHYGMGDTCTPGPEVCDGVDNDCNGAIDEGGVCRPARNPSSAYPHTVNGTFTDWMPGTNAPYEWFDIQPAVGRYTYLYVDFDGHRLHLLNDWHYMGSDVSATCYNEFNVFTGGGAEHWNIKVYGDGHIDVTRNDMPYMSPDIDGAKSFGRSPQVPDVDHTIWELSFPAEPGAWHVALHDPGPTFNCEAGQLAGEPSQIQGSLDRGGSSVLADAHEMMAATPRLDALQPGEGAPGTSVTATGSDWPDPAPKVRFLQRRGRHGCRPRPGERRLGDLHGAGALRRQLPCGAGLRRRREQQRSAVHR